MAQHYLLSSKSKNLNLKQIFRLSEDETFQLLKANRWGNPNNIRDGWCPEKCADKNKQTKSSENRVYLNV